MARVVLGNNICYIFLKYSIYKKMSHQIHLFQLSSLHSFSVQFETVRKSWRSVTYTQRSTLLPYKRVGALKKLSSASSLNEYLFDKEDR